MKFIPVSKISSTSKAIRRLGIRMAKASQTLALRVPCRSKVASGLKVSATLAATLGSSVPYMQGIAGAVTQIVSHVDAVQSNKKQCKEIAALASEIVDALVIELNEVDESQLDESLRLALADLERKFERTGITMQHLRQRGFLRRLLSKDDDAKSLSEHRQSLQNALMILQLKQIVRVRCELVTSNVYVASRSLRSSSGKLNDQSTSPDTCSTAGGGPRAPLLSAFFFDARTSL